MHGYGDGIAYSLLVKPTAGPERKDDKVLIAGDVTERWEQADDLTWIFKLRPGVKFHNLPPVNGRELDAADVVYSFNRQKAKGVTAAFLPPMEKIEAVDKQTLKITTPRPDADFLVTLAAVQNKILAREAAGDRDDLKEGPTIGTGPWIVDKFEPQVVARLRRNPDYFLKGVPYVDAVEWVRQNDDSVMLAAFRTQEVGFSPSGVARRDIEAIKKESPQLITGSFRQLGQGLEMGYNVTRPPFSDRRVRQAFQLALDRQAIIDTVFEGDGWLTPKIILPDFSYNVPEDELRNKWYKRDLARARQLLAEAGWRPDAEVELVNLKIRNSWTSAAELTVAQLKEAGINARIREVDNATWASYTTLQREWDAFHGPTTNATSTNGDLFARYHSTGNRNFLRVKDPVLDDLIEKQATMTRDPEGRKKLLLDLQRHLLEEAYTTLVWGSATPYARWPWFKNYRLVGQPPSHPELVTWVWLDK